MSGRDPAWPAVLASPMSLGLLDDPYPRVVADDGGRLEAELAAWAADTGAAEAAEERLQRHLFAQQERESATMTGILVNLAERGAAVELHLRRGSVTGVLTSVGPDVVEIRNGADMALVALAAVVGVQAPSVQAGDGAPVDERTLAVRLSGLVGAGSLVTTRSDERQWTGEVTSVGRDALVLDVGGRAIAISLSTVLAVVVHGPR